MTLTTIPPITLETAVWVHNDIYVPNDLTMVVWFSAVSILGLVRAEILMGRYGQVGLAIYLLQVDRSLHLVKLECLVITWLASVSYLSWYIRVICKYFLVLNFLRALNIFPCWFKLRSVVVLILRVVKLRLSFLLIDTNDGWDQLLNVVGFLTIGVLRYQLVM